MPHFLLATRMLVRYDEDGIEVRVQNHDVWLTQKAIARLFDVDRSVVTKYLKNIFDSKELSEKSTCANFAQTADDGKTYQYKFYSLSAIIKWLSKKVKQVFIVTVWGLWYNDKKEKLYFFGGGENMLESVQWIIGRRNYVVDLVVVVEYII